MTGLWCARRFRRLTQWLRYPLLLFVLLINNTLKACRFRSTGDTKVLVWSKESCYHPTIGHSITRLVNEAQHLPFHEVNGSPSRERCNPEASEMEHAPDVADRC
jgi:hypothetical protein